MLAPSKLLMPFRTFPSMIRKASQALTEKLLAVPRVELAEGEILYMLIKIYVHGETRFARTLVRGAVAKKHDHIYDAFKIKMEKIGLCTKCIGGGKMDNDGANHHIKIYGSSRNFGKADHEKTKLMLESWTKYKDYQIEVHH